MEALGRRRSSTSIEMISRSHPHADRMRIAFLGDVMLGRLVDQIFPEYNNEPDERRHAFGLLFNRDSSAIEKIKELKHKYVWGDVLEDLLAADVRIINLETSVTTHDKKWPDKAFNYRMHPANVQALKEAKIDYVSLANNHSLDFGEEGMIDTMRSLDRFEIKYAGVGLNKKQAETPALIDCKGHRIAVFSFADHPEFWTSTDTRAGINFIDVQHYTKHQIAHITDLVQDARHTHRAELVVISVHWGSNYCWMPPQKFTEFAHDLINTCGVDVIHGHSSHHVQGIEFYKGKPIIYGCGDFVDDYATDDDYKNDLGFVYFLEWDFSTKRAMYMDLLPTRIHLFSVHNISRTTRHKSEEKARKWLARKMKGLCERYSTDIQEMENGHLLLSPTCSSSSAYSSCSDSSASSTPINSPSLM